MTPELRLPPGSTTQMHAETLGLEKASRSVELVPPLYPALSTALRSIHDSFHDPYFLGTLPKASPQDFRVTLSNSQGSVSKLQLTLSFPEVFTRLPLSGSCGSTLSASGSCVVPLRFTPQETGYAEPQMAARFVVNKAEQNNEFAFPVEVIPLSGAIDTRVAEAANHVEKAPSPFDRVVPSHMVTAMPSQKLLVGSTVYRGAVGDMAVTRFAPDFATERSSGTQGWATAGFTKAVVHRLASLPGDKIVAVGHALRPIPGGTAAPVPDAVVAFWNKNGQRLSAVGTDGRVAIPLGNEVGPSTYLDSVAQDVTS